MVVEVVQSPSWDRLFEAAVGQEGHFTTKQAAEAGYSPQLLLKYLKNGRVIRVRRGVYRIVHFPAGEHEDLAALWLWSEQRGVFSHETALMLHNLSDALPAKRHMTVPASWSKRRLRLPRGVVLHFADVPKTATTWLGPVPLTTPLRTVADCAAAEVAEDLVHQAVQQGVRRKLFSRAEAKAAINQARRQRDAAADIR